MLVQQPIEKEFERFGVSLTVTGSSENCVPIGDVKIRKDETMGDLK